MKNKCKFLFILIFISVFLFYKTVSIVAMAAEENTEPKLIEESAAEAEAEPVKEPVVKPESEQEPIEEPIVEPEPEQEAIEKSVAEPESEQETIEKSVAELEPEQEPIEKSDAETETVQELIEKFAAVPEPEQTISTGPALVEWMEAHKNTGGTVKLADHVVLDGEYSFCSNGMNRPSVFVDTDKYTITVTGEIELFSDDHVIFAGEPDGKSIFYVAEKGMLSMQGVVVESESYALWQAEGAGLAVSDCRISGSVHYADTPFVIYQDSVCLIVETGQTLHDVLPEQINCSVNRQGQVSNQEWVALSWNLKGTEKQQAERRRFELQGSFLHAASAKPAQCMVVYNDYPLTFTDVKASVSGGFYIFWGWYTKPEEALPITVISEYSFDGENWLTCEEAMVTDIDAGFLMIFSSEQRDRVAHSNIYIRLQWNDSGTRYFSNVLCYAADDLESVEDIGGSRGGGTSIINPPDEPQKSLSNAPEKKTIQNVTLDTHSDNVETGNLSDTDQTEKGDGDNGSSVAYDEQSLNAEPVNADTEQSSNAELSDANAGQPIYRETSDANEDQSLYAQTPDTDAEPVLALASAQVNAQMLHVDTQQNNHIVIVLGFVLLSVIIGAAGFYVRFRSGTNR